MKKTHYTYGFILLLITVGLLVFLSYWDKGDIKQDVVSNLAKNTELTWFNREAGFVGMGCFDCTTIIRPSGESVRLLGVKQLEHLLLISEAKGTLELWSRNQFCETMSDPNLQKDVDGTPLAYIVWAREFDVPSVMRTKSSFEGKTLLNTELIKRGLAKAKCHKGMPEHIQKLFAKAEDEARINGRGIWWFDNQPKPTGDIKRDASIMQLWKRQIPLTMFAFSHFVQLADIEKVKLFVEAGMDVSQRLDSNSFSPLELAAQNPSLDVFKLLFSAKVRPRQEELQDILNLATAHRQLKIIDYLLSSSANINGKGSDGMTCLSAFLSAKENKTNGVETVEFLIQRGADVNVTSNHRDTPLMIAMRNGDFEAAKLLINSGADVNATSNLVTPLMIAARNGDFVATELLINSGADVNAKSGFNTTALMEAIKSRSEDVANILIDKGADVNAIDDWGNTALTIARRQGSHDIIALLVKSGAKERKKGIGSLKAIELPPLISASMAGNVETVKKMLSEGADTEVKEPGGMTALMFAIVEKKMNVVRLLIDYKANINSQCKTGVTPLMWAAMSNDKDMVELLLKNGADLKAVDVKGFTAKKWADHLGSMDAFIILDDAEKRTSK